MRIPTLPIPRPQRCPRKEISYHFQEVNALHDLWDLIPLPATPDLFLKGVILFHHHMLVACVHVRPSTCLSVALLKFLVFLARSCGNDQKDLSASCQQLNEME